MNQNICTWRNTKREKLPSVLKCSEHRSVCLNKVTTSKAVTSGEKSIPWFKLDPFASSQITRHIRCRTHLPTPKFTDTEISETRNTISCSTWKIHRSLVTKEFYICFSKIVHKCFQYHHTRPPKTKVKCCAALRNSKLWSTLDSVCRGVRLSYFQLWTSTVACPFVRKVFICIPFMGGGGMAGYFQFSACPRFKKQTTFVQSAAVVSPINQVQSPLLWLWQVLHVPPSP